MNSYSTVDILRSFNLWNRFESHSSSVELDHSKSKAVKANGKDSTNINQHLTPPISEENLKTIHSIFFKINPEALTSHKIGIVVLKIVGVSVSFAATYSFIGADMKLPTSHSVRVLFATGDIIGWGTVTAWSMRNIINHAFEKQFVDTGKKINRCAFTIKWLAIVILGLCSAIPTAYTTYRYNEGDLFWTIFTPSVLSFFSMRSLDELFQTLSSSGGLLKRIKYRCNGKNREVLIAKNNMVKIIKNTIKSSTENTLQNEITKIFLAESDDNQVVKKSLMAILESGLEYRIKKRENYSHKLNFCENIVGKIGAIMALSSPIIDGTLVYSAYRLISQEETIIIPVLILLAVTPGLYLILKTSRDFYKKGFRTLADPKTYAIDSLKQAPYKSLKIAPLLLFTVLGVGAYTLVSQESVGFDSFLKIFLVCAATTTLAIILLTSMSETVDEMADTFKSCYESPKEADHRKFIDQMEILKDFFYKMPKKKFLSLLNELNIPDFNYELLKGNLQELPKIQEILDVIQARFSNESTDSLVLDSDSDLDSDLELQLNAK